MLPLAIEVLKALVFVSVIFVWVVRYQNIIEEFKTFGYPAWLRDLVGILKITSAVLIISNNPALVKLGALSLAILMMCALGTHLKIKNPPKKMLPSFALLCSSVLILIQ